MYVCMHACIYQSIDSPVGFLEENKANARGLDFQPVPQIKARDPIRHSEGTIDQCHCREQTTQEGKELRGEDRPHPVPVPAAVRAEIVAAAPAEFVVFRQHHSSVLVS